MNKILFFCLMFLIILPGRLNAEVITFKNGKTIGGKIVERNDSYIKIDLGLGIPVTYYLDEIESIWTQPDAELMDAFKVDEIEDEIEKVAPLPKVEKKPVSMAITEEESLVELQPKPVKTDVALNVFTLVLFFAVVYGFIVYVTAMIPLYVLGSAFEESSVWVAWIPIAQYFLLCKIAHLPTWLMVLLLIPGVGVIVNVILWSGVSRECEHSRLLGLLMAVPFVNLLLPWYLAYTK